MRLTTRQGSGEKSEQKVDSAIGNQDYILNMNETAVYFSMHMKHVFTNMPSNFLLKNDNSKTATAGFMNTTSGLQLQSCFVLREHICFNIPMISFSPQLQKYVIFSYSIPT